MNKSNSTAMKSYVKPRVLQTYAVLLETDLLGESMYRKMGPVRIDGQESAGEYDYSDGTFNNVWLD